MTTVKLTPPTSPFHATVTVPGDKSLSHRTLMFSALAAGTSQFSNLGTGHDVASTAAVLRALGVAIEPGQVHSPGRSGLAASTLPLDCGNSGTTIRIMAGLLSPFSFTSTLTGDESLRTRPMERLVEPLGDLGAPIGVAVGGVAPITVGGVDTLVGADVKLPMASAQVRSAVEFAALHAEGESTVDSPPGFRDHTERWLETLGLGTWETDSRFRIHPGAIPVNSYQVPGDPSSAAFLWAAAAIRPGSAVTTRDVSLNPGRIGFLQILEMMGARIEAEVTRSLLGDPVGNVTVHGGPLQGIGVAGDLAASAVDELPLVAVLGSFADGATTVADAGELRGKESDRIATSCEMIRALGGGAEESGDGFRVIGLGWLEGGTVDSHGDHRIAMAAGVAATGANDAVRIEHAEAAAVSWPDFYDTLGEVWASG